MAAALMVLIKAREGDTSLSNTPFRHKVTLFVVDTTLVESKVIIVWLWPHLEHLVLGSAHGAEVIVALV